MSRKREKKVEYKETEIFELFPKFSYTPFQRKRVVLFHGYWKNLKKMVNYAANFDEPNKVCLIYLVGEIEEGKAEKALMAAGCSDRVCVVTAWFPESAMPVWAEYDELRHKMAGSGGWDKDGDKPTKEFLAYQLKSREYYASQMTDEMDGQYGMLGVRDDVEFCARMVSEYDAMMAVIGRYEKLKAQSQQKTFWEFRLHRVGHLEKPYAHGRLDELIKKIFPFGAEAGGVGRAEFLTPSSIEAAIEFGKTGSALPGRVKLTDGMISAAVKALGRLIAKRIEEQGYCTLDEIKETASLPPFGLAYDGFSAACVARALKRFDNRTLLLYDGCSTFEVHGHERSVFDMLFSPAFLSGRKRFILKTSCLYLESQPHKKVKQFMARLWDVKIQMPGTLMGLYLGKSLCGTHKIPLAYIDERLLRLTLWNVDFWDRGQVEELAEEIERNGDEIVEAYRRYKDANANIPDAVWSLMQADYSWVWTREEYETILWKAERFGPWPWDLETWRRAYKEGEERRKARK